VYCELAPRERADLSIFDVRGALIKKLVDGTSGSHFVRWNGLDADGNRVGAGVYFVKLRLGANQPTVKVVVAR
jgi:hypothetical protein